MLIIAQRVSTADAEGINAYLHEHGDRSDWAWALPPGVPDQDPGRLVRESTQIRGRGRVAAFLDIAGPDGVPVDDLRWGFEALGRLLEIDASLPLVIGAGPLFFRFELELRRRQDWQAELRALFDAGIELLEP